MRHAVCLACLVAGPGAAAPLLGSGRDVEGVRVYRDHADARVHYYAPGKLTAALDRSGAPQLSFLQMRYVGTALAGDRGAFRTHSQLSFRVRMEAAPADRLAKARTALGPGAVLKPLPIRRVSATLNYVSLDSGAAPPQKPAGEGKLEEAEAPSPGQGYWTERVFSVAPNEVTSASLWESFQQGRVQLSLSYAFHSDGIGPDEPVPAPGAPPSMKGPHVVLADTLAVTVDAARYPDRLRRIDVNESIPAQYAVLSVACYDFNNELRPDLQVKIVEIEAKSVNGRPVLQQAVFSRSTPDVTSASLRFPFAVSLKDGYRYRCREITPAGEERVRDWQPGRPWAQLLDATTPPAERPARPAEGEKEEPK